MIYVFVLVAILTSGDVTVLQSRTSFDTVEACEAARTEMVEKAKPELAEQGALIVKSACSTEEDYEKALEDAPAEE